MLRATQVRPTGPQMNGPYETITLDHTARHRRRMVMKADGGLSFLLDLEQAQALRHGDGLVLEDGPYQSLALPEPLTEVRAGIPRIFAWPIRSATAIWKPRLRRSVSLSAGITLFPRCSWDLAPVLLISRRSSSQKQAPMAITTEPQQLLQLLAFMSPAFPVGGFAYSHGLERAIDDGIVTSADEVRKWIEPLLVHGSGWNDAVLFAQADDAGEAVQAEIDELALALAASRERACGNF